MNGLRESLLDVYHGLAMALLALILGTLWAAYIATHHEQLHGGFEAQEAQLKQVQIQHLMQELNMDHLSSVHDQSVEAESGHHHGVSQTGGESNHAAGHQHSHSGSLAMDAMQRLLRGHIHFMGIGTLVAVLILIVAFTSLKPGWKKLLGWTFGIGALAYPPAWIMMGLRTVEMGPEASEASVMWLFGPAVVLLLASMLVLFGVLLLEMTKLNKNTFFRFLFEAS